MDPRNALPLSVSSLEEARHVQERIRALVRHVPFRLDGVRLVGAADVTFLGAKEVVVAGIVVFDLASRAVVEERTAVCRHEPERGGW